MEEKILIQSEHYNIKKIAKVISIILIIISVLTLAIKSYTVIRHINGYAQTYNDMENDIDRDNYESYLCDKHEKEILSDAYYISDIPKKIKEIHPTVMSYAYCHGYILIRYYIIKYLLFSLIPLSPIPIIWLIYLWLNSFSLTVTNRRVYGKVPMRRVDLPLDFVSAIGTSFFRGIDVGTSSGRIRFKFVKNQAQVHSALSTLLEERQHTKTTSNNQNTSNADELKKYKDLLDSGVITQAEFDEKKKQLLGL